jgi:hypothetical protein
MLCGFVYDFVPGGKMGIGLLMTGLNIMNLGGFVFILCLARAGQISMLGLRVFVAIVGFASVIPVSLPFQVYAMAIGGVEHCGMIVAGFELCAQVIEASA